MSPGAIRDAPPSGPAARLGRQPAGGSRVTPVTRTPRTVRLSSRPHIDLQRVAGALCRP
ncbi:putative leader peptide [Streptomyces hirsutus]|uniref:putative leader peptide n=1 Tax=Streptomyces hirsutus TaxID=35620 RepID=UPI0036BEF971